MIILKDISKNYGEKTVLNNINLTLKKGSVNCILGHSGVGKTTLLNILAGLESYHGQISNSFSKISYAFQTPCLVDNMTIEENILFASKEVSREEIKCCLKKLEMQNMGNTPAKNLSEGEKQRVNFLRALLYFPELIILDETFSSLDVKSKLLCEKLLLEYKQKYNFTVIMVTHDYSLALSLAQEIIVLSTNKTEVIDVKIDKNGKKSLTENQLKDKLLLAFNV